RNNGEVHIEDLGSYNGIRVNNARIAERVSLRVSDQVQIGDYKLYLKAEGVEQVDDARTMPIERVDGAVHTNTATDVIPAIAATSNGPGVTAPITAQTPIPATPASGAALVGSPNRTLVAVADTDPSGRPIASAAAVAALTAPVGYGKLVVLSSNFAGKEFELSRTQMIVGRTDENDIVVNHRSISRNHAKLVRENDTGRYTISDLQSSNGVRVNGQDYGKVELRRGDVIDLGHVRLRFIEPGEDFVFSRDAVITDVPETGGKRGLMVAIILGVVVLIGVAVFAFTRKSDKDANDGKVVNGSQTSNDIDAGSDKVALNPSDAVEAVDPPVVDSGSGTTAVNPDAKQLEVTCLNARTNKQWVELEECATALAKIDGPKGKEFLDRSKSESKAEVSLRALRDAVKADSYKNAQAALAAIGDNSVYRKDADTAFDRYKKQLTDGLISDLRKYKTDCKSYNQRLRNAEQAQGTDEIANAGRAAVQCKTIAVEPPPNRCTADSCGAGERCEGGKCVKVAAVAKTCPEVPCGAGLTCEGGKCIKPAVAACDPNDIKTAEDRGDGQNAQGNFAAAMAAWESQLRCKGSLVLKIYMAACRGHKFNDAKRYFKALPKDRQESLSQMCLGEGFDPRTP
ncbi:MAG: FHA domain-containing protein, partial [Kofleriaceae bacterium]